MTDEWINGYRNSFGGGDNKSQAGNPPADDKAKTTGYWKDDNADPTECSLIYREGEVWIVKLDV